MEERKKYFGPLIGNRLTSKKLHELLPSTLKEIRQVYQASPQSLLEAWPAVIAPEILPYTRALHFSDKVLYVEVRNSAVLSLLANMAEKRKIIGALRRKVPCSDVKNIIFRIGAS